MGNRTSQKADGSAGSRADTGSAAAGPTPPECRTPPGCSPRRNTALYFGLTDRRLF